MNDQGYTDALDWAIHAVAEAGESTRRARESDIKSPDHNDFRRGYYAGYLAALHEIRTKMESHRPGA